MYSHILLLIKLYEEKLLNISGFKIKFKFTIGKFKCMARIEDLANCNKQPNINKRCSRNILSLGLCKTHLRKLKYGKVDDYPPEELLYRYKKYDKHIETTIDLNHVEFCKSKILKPIKKLNLIIRMSFTKMDCDASIKTITREYKDCSLEDLYQRVLDKNQIDRNFITVDEKKTILKTIKKYSTKNSRTELLKYIKDINVNLLINIRIRDNDFNSVDLFKVYFYGENYLINENKNIVGIIQDWVDEEEIVPKEYKTTDNKVLNPHSNLPINEVILNSSSKIYTDLTPGIYREYFYNEELEAFMITNNILL